MNYIKKDALFFLLPLGILLLLLIIFFSNVKKNDSNNLKDAKKSSDVSLYNDAEDEYIKGNYEKVKYFLEELLDRFPVSDVAAASLSKLAALYQNKYLKNISEREALKKAEELYREVYVKYPHSRQGPLGLFMAGFIAANELRDFTTAQEYYLLFIREYPNHELVNSAREELNNIHR